MAATRGFHENTTRDTFAPYERESARDRVSVQPVPSSALMADDPLVNASDQARFDAFARWQREAVGQGMSGEQRRKLNLLVRADLEADLAIREERERFSNLPYGAGPAYSRPALLYEPGRTEVLGVEAIQQRRAAIRARHDAHAKANLDATEVDDGGKTTGRTNPDPRHDVHYLMRSYDSREEMERYRAAHAALSAPAPRELWDGYAQARQRLAEEARRKIVVRMAAHLGETTREAVDALAARLEGDIDARAAAEAARRAARGEPADAVRLREEYAREFYGV